MREGLRASMEASGDPLLECFEEQIRKRVREIIAKRPPGGRLALGTGNSVASYIKCENYFAMIDEARRS